MSAGAGVSPPPETRTCISTAPPTAADELLRTAVTFGAAACAAGKARIAVRATTRKRWETFEQGGDMRFLPIVIDTARSPASIKWDASLFVPDRLQESQRLTLAHAPVRFV